MNDVTVIQSVVTETPIDSAKQLVTLVGGIAFLLTMNWRLCLLILIILPVLVLVAKIFGRKLKTLSTSLQDHTAALSTLAEEVISGIRIVKSFVQTTREDARFSSQVDRTLELTMRRAGIMALFIPVISLLTFSAAAAVMWYGGHQVIEGTVTPGDLFAFVLFAGILIAFLAGLAAYFLQMPGLSLAVSAMFVVLMSGLILYETSNIIHGGETNYITATVSLFVSIYNLFISLLQIFGVFGGDNE